MSGESHFQAIQLRDLEGWAILVGVEFQSTGC